MGIDGWFGSFHDESINEIGLYKKNHPGRILHQYHEKPSRHTHCMDNERFKTYKERRLIMDVK